MPIFEVKTNLPRDKIPDDFILKAVETLANVLDKPVESIAVAVIPDSLMSFGRSKDPCALIYLGSIGTSLSEQKNIAVSKAVFDLLESSLGIPDNRAYIRFDVPLPYEIGVRHTTFAEYSKTKLST